MFVFLTAVVVYRPPAPLAFSAAQAESLWADMRHTFHDLRSGIRQGVAGLSHNIEQLGDAVSHGVHDIAENLEHAVSGALASAAGGAGAGGGRHITARDLSQGVSHLSDQLGEAAEEVNRRLTEALGAALQWPVHRWPTYIYMAGAMTCLLVSSVCHLLSCCPQHVTTLLWKMDYTGITILIVTSFYPSIYYYFMCAPFWRDFYLATTTAMGAAVVAVSYVSWLQATRFRVLRASLYAGLGLWGVVPVAHQWIASSDVLHVRQVGSG